MTETKPKKVKRKLSKLNILTLVVVTIATIEVIGLLVGGAGLLFFLKDKPAVTIDKFESTQSSVVYDVNGEVVAELGMTIRDNITYDEIPTSLIDAFVAVEDSRYFTHNGFDISRFTMAMLKNLRSLSFSQGGSTFTMQLVKNTYFVDDEAGINAPKKISRKVQEIVMATELERISNKKTIFEFYLNKLNFGGNRNIRGVEKAANYYFGKSVTDLNLDESAMLAGVINAPNAFNPFKNLTKATKRRNEVLYQMYNHGYITETEYKLAKTVKVEDLLVDESGRVNHGTSSSYQAYIDAVVSEIAEITNADPYTTPMKIYTYMDQDVQKVMDTIQNGEHEDVTFPDEWIETASISVNNKTGAVNAILGGRNYAGGGKLLLNHAIDQYKQPGSSIKPIVDYAPAFEHLGWSTSHVLTDKPIAYPGTSFVIHNTNGKWAGQVTLKDAVGNSLNTTAIQALEQVIEKTSTAEVVEYLNKMGFDQVTTKNFNIQYGIGGGEFTISTLQLAGAQAALLNGGQYIKPHTISRVEFLDGKNPINPIYEPVQAISSQASYLTSTILYNNVYGGYANLMQILKDNYPVYAKTGTSDWGNSGTSYGIPVGSIKDAWMVASTSDYTVATWLGYEKASKDKQSYIKMGDYLKNIQGHITNAVLDANVELHGKPAEVTKPDGISSITHILGTFPYAKTIDGMDEKYVTTGLIKTDAVQLVDPQTSTVEPLDESKIEKIELINGEITINWPTYPDTDKLSVASEEMDISLKRADGSTIISATGKRLFDYSWVFGAIRYKADVSVNGENVLSVTSDSNKTTRPIDAKPGDNIKVCLYYAYDKKSDVKSNSVCKDYTLKNEEVSLQLPGNGMTKENIALHLPFVNNKMKVTFEEIPTTDASKFNTYYFTFKNKDYNPGDIISNVYQSEIYGAEIICKWYAAPARKIVIAHRGTSDCKPGGSVKFEYNITGDLPGDDNSVLWSITSGANITIDENGLVTIPEDVEVGTSFTVTCYLKADPTILDTTTLQVNE